MEGDIEGLLHILNNLGYLFDAEFEFASAYDQVIRSDTDKVMLYKAT